MSSHLDVCLYSMPGLRPTARLTACLSSAFVALFKALRKVLGLRKVSCVQSICGIA